MFYKIGLLETFAKLTGKKPVPESFLNKVVGWRVAILLKNRVHHVFFYKFCKDFKNNYFVENYKLIANSDFRNA